VRGGGDFVHPVPQWVYDGGIYLDNFDVTLVAELHRSVLYMSSYRIVVIHGRVDRLMPGGIHRVSELWDIDQQPVKLMTVLQSYIQHAWTSEVHTVARNRLLSMAEEAGYSKHDARLGKWIGTHSNSYVKSLCDAFAHNIMDTRIDSSIASEEILSRANTSDMRSWGPWFKMMIARAYLWCKTHTNWRHYVAIWFVWRFWMRFGPRRLSLMQPFIDAFQQRVERVKQVFTGAKSKLIGLLGYLTGSIRAIEPEDYPALKLRAVSALTNFWRNVGQMVAYWARYFVGLVSNFGAFVDRNRRPMSLPSLALIGIVGGLGVICCIKRCKRLRQDLVLKGQCLGETWKEMPIAEDAKLRTSVVGSCQVLKPRATLIGYGVGKFIPYYFASCEHNQLASVCSRIINPKPEVLSIVLRQAKAAFLRDNTLALVGVYHERKRVSKQEFLDGFPLSRRKILKNAYERHLIAPQRARHYHSANVFVKVEPYLKAVKPTPRSIQDKNPAYLVAVGPTVATLQKSICSVFSSDDNLFIASGSNFETMGAWTERYINMGWTVHENDFTRFDSTIGIQLLNIQFDLFKLAGCPMHVLNLLRKQLVTHGRNKQGTIHYRVPGTVQSGVSNTSIGGSLMNMVLLYYAFGRVLDSPTTQLAIMVLGDDSIICTEKPVDLQSVESTLILSGMKPKITRRDNPFDIEMCSAVLVPTSEGRIFLPKLGRILAKTFYTTSNVLQQRDGRQILLDATCDSLVNVSQVLPIIPKMIERLRSDKPSSLQLFNQYSARVETVVTRCVETEQFFVHRYGFSLEYLDSWDLPEPGLIFDPIIEAIVERDLGIPSTCPQLSIVNRSTWLISVLFSPWFEETLKHIPTTRFGRWVAGAAMGLFEGMLYGDNREATLFRMMFHGILAVMPKKLAIITHALWNHHCLSVPKHTTRQLNLFDTNMAGKKSIVTKRKVSKRQTKQRPKLRPPIVRGVNPAPVQQASKRVGVKGVMQLQKFRDPSQQSVATEMAKYALAQINPPLGNGAKIPDHLPNRSTALQVLASVPFSAATTWVNMSFAPNLKASYWIRNDEKGVDEFKDPDTPVPGSDQLSDLYAKYRLVSFSVKVQFTGALINAPGLIMCKPSPPTSPYPTVAEFTSRASFESAVDGCQFNYRKYSPVEDEYRPITDAFDTNRDGVLLMRITNTTPGSTYIVQLCYNFELLPLTKMEQYVPVGISPVAPMQRAVVDNYVSSLPQSSNLQNMIKFGAATPDAGKKSAVLETVTKGAGERLLSKVGSGIGALIDWLF